MIPSKPGEVLIYKGFGFCLAYLITLLYAEVLHMAFNAKERITTLQALVSQRVFMLFLTLCL